MCVLFRSKLSDKDWRSAKHSESMKNTQRADRPAPHVCYTPSAHDSFTKGNASMPLLFNFISQESQRKWEKCQHLSVCLSVTKSWHRHNLPTHRSGTAECLPLIHFTITAGYAYTVKSNFNYQVLLSKIYPPWRDQTWVAGSSKPVLLLPHFGIRQPCLQRIELHTYVNMTVTQNCE